MTINNIKERIKGYFFVRPTAKLRVREIERVLNAPLPSVIRYCKELEKEGILAQVRMGRVVFYTGNRTNQAYILEKKLFNLKQMCISGLVEHIKKELYGPTIVLFGSYAAGEDTETSDVDVYIETPSKKEVNVKKFESILQRKIQILRCVSIKKVPNVHLANNIVNGITLHGALEVFL